ncbi:PucR family transcriptional regulator [Streptomyces sp. SDr-06]|uniref:PucR family transcriptional regulator n=1 Tax=Streptomyces sp. SDr-06 TaxID=2267702 RepID=UPI000DE93CB7|nr:PucR family transcriptional regulator [Streptomyces sp. SDr-06]RCH69048.1 PucR family transcriptional regulator [Streptomyces sp. SDr-06]
MPTAAQPPDIQEPLGPLPQEFAAIMRPELPGLLKEIGAEITRAYPEYARLLEGPYGEAIRVGVEQNLTVFVDQVASPSAPSTLRDEMCRRFGRFEAYEGRSLDTLQGAYRLGARVALRRAKKIGRRYHLSPALMLSFADALFTYVEQLEALSREGYLEVTSFSGERSDALRRRLLHLILAGSPVPRAAIAELAERAHWPLPERVTLVALRSGADVTRAALDNDVLIDPGEPLPHLLVPGPVDEVRRRMLDAALHGSWSAVGLEVPIGDASDSLRWARQVLELAASGVIDNDSGTLYCEDHLVTLWLRSDPALLEHLARRELAPLDALTPGRRDRLVETLRTWLATRGTAAQMGQLLDVHPQTVRYRMRTLESIFGDRLTEPEHRFATELVLRARDLGHRDRA